jgi:hypothetical protein
MSEQSERMEITSTALLAELLDYAGHAGWCYTCNDAGGEAEGGEWTTCYCGWADLRTRIKAHLAANSLMGG